MTEVLSNTHASMQKTSCMVSVSQKELKDLYKKMSKYEKQLLESQKLNQELLQKIIELNDRETHRLGLK